MKIGQLGRDGIRVLIENKLGSLFGVTAQTATDAQVMKASAVLIREAMNRLLAEERENVENRPEREVHYLSMEFLMGRSLMKNAWNLGMGEALTGALADMGRSPADIFECEEDAGLGSGGLGRLAACYIDSMASLGLEATGYSLCYELGIFRQKLENGQQVELADAWPEAMESWLVPRGDDTCEVRFGGTLDAGGEHLDYSSVLAVPRDMLIAGFGGNSINTLRLWEAKSPLSLDLGKFAGGEYAAALAERNMAEVITKVLYPADETAEGKTLRLKQQYFFCSASAQDILRTHMRKWGDIRSFSKHHAIQINDTHPTLIIPELMRLLMDDHGLSWNEAWQQVTNSVTYTNHTIMPEALEVWPAALMEALLPQVFSLITEIDRRYRMELALLSFSEAQIAGNAVLQDGGVHMAKLCVATCKKVNGVSGLHGEIIRRDLFPDIAAVNPGKFTHVTNGIDHRRWLSQVNPRLDSLLRELIGDSFHKGPEHLERLAEYRDDNEILLRLREIKGFNKLDFAEYLWRAQNIALNTDAVFDVQVKRLHEYKRQLLCAMLITDLRRRLHENPRMEFMPRCFIFGAKASANYKTAKRIIELLCSLAADINADPVCKGRLQVVFLENYRVSLAERLMPAAEVSEQISTAGKEASGTGNMKLMMNGAVTIGTLDGANVEMFERLGGGNMFLFGLSAEQVDAVKAMGYSPLALVQKNERLLAVLDRFSRGFSDGKSYADLVSGLLGGGDPYMLIADFESYLDCHDRLYEAARDRMRFSRMSLTNIAQSGVFAADRAITEYAEKIWHL